MELVYNVLKDRKIQPGFSIYLYLSRFAYIGYFIAILCKLHAFNLNYTVLSYGIIVVSVIDCTFTIAFQIMRIKDLSNHMMAVFVLNILMGVVIVFFYFPWLLYASVISGKYWRGERSYYKIGTLVWICESIGVLLFTLTFILITIVKGPSDRKGAVIASKS